MKRNQSNYVPLWGSDKSLMIVFISTRNCFLCWIKKTFISKCLLRKWNSKITMITTTFPIKHFNISKVAFLSFSSFLWKQSRAIASVICDMNKHVNSHLRIQSLIRIVSVVLRHWASAYFSVIVHSWTLLMDITNGRKGGNRATVGTLIVDVLGQGPLQNVQ